MSPEFEPHYTYQPTSSDYQILPFRFLAFDRDRYILVNEVGEYLLVNNEIFRRFVKHDLKMRTDDYQSLKSKHFLLDSSSTTTIDLLATKYRTKKGFLTGFTKLHIFVVSLRCDHSCHYCQ